MDRFEKVLLVVMIVVVTAVVITLLTLTWGIITGQVS